MRGGLTDFRARACARTRGLAWTLMFGLVGCLMLLATGCATASDDVAEASASITAITSPDPAEAEGSVSAENTASEDDAATLDTATLQSLIDELYVSPDAEGSVAVDDDRVPPRSSADGIPLSGGEAVSSFGGVDVILPASVNAELFTSTTGTFYELVCTNTASGSTFRVCAGISPADLGPGMDAAAMNEQLNAWSGREFSYLDEVTYENATMSFTARFFLDEELNQVCVYAVVPAPGSRIYGRGITTVEIDASADTFKSDFALIDEILSSVEQEGHYSAGTAASGEDSSAKRDDLRGVISGASGTAASSLTYVDGVYFASCAGYGDDIAVAVTIEGDRISEVEVGSGGDAATDDEATMQMFADVPAAVVANQGTEGVDAVAGATVSQDALLSAVDTCLELARR